MCRFRWCPRKVPLFGRHGFSAPHTGGREQLNGWMRDPELWPEELTHEMFLEWFDCELSTMIWDMLKTKIKPRV